MEHLLVTRLLKGIFNARPLVKPLFPTWELNVVLGHLKAWDCLFRLSLGDLMRKTSFLLVWRPADTVELRQGDTKRFSRLYFCNIRKM